MRALKIAGAATAAVIVVLALLLIIGIPSGFLSSEIQARVERETGYRLTISGGTKIGLWPKLNVTLTDVTLENPKDSETSNRLTVGRVQAPGTEGQQIRTWGDPETKKADQTIANFIDNVNNLRPADSWRRGKTDGHGWNTIVPLLCEGGLREKQAVTPGAQTERRGDARPVISEG